MNHYSDKELEAYRKNIKHQLKTLETLEGTTQDAAQIVMLDQSTMGRLSRMDALQGQAMAQATVQRRQLEVKQLRKALIRIDEGVFGECEECLELIDPRRVTHNPAVALCIKCATEIEKQ